MTWSGAKGREPVATWFFSLVVVRKGDAFVLVHETKHGQLHYLPGGRAEPGETLAEAAVRETLEEAGIPVVLDGLLRLEHSPAPDGTARVRALFLAHPADETPLKQVADEHSQVARWVTLAELARYPLRGEEVRALFEYVERGGAVFPLEVLALEGAPWRGPADQSPSPRGRVLKKVAETAPSPGHPERSRGGT